MIRTLRLGAALFGWYVKAVKAIADRHKCPGGFINNRPFLTGALIKATWMILGDGGPALNDEKLKQKLKNLTSDNAETPGHGALRECSLDTYANNLRQKNGQKK